MSLKLAQGTRTATVVRAWPALFGGPPETVPPVQTPFDIPPGGSPIIFCGLPFEWDAELNCYVYRRPMWNGQQATWTLRFHADGDPMEWELHYPDGQQIDGTWF